ncbi:hypothetical protein IWQ52_001043 [Labrenzia sp. EL_159]|nr:hypothetical protein [Labrenzia sp. EL_162]MBG6193541.1 hypothetical protein [Labrenzia sp. EL_159]
MEFASVEEMVPGGKKQNLTCLIQSCFIYQSASVEGSSELTLQQSLDLVRSSIVAVVKTPAFVQAQIRMEPRARGPA